MKTKLILENGNIFIGESFGYQQDTIGELVFTTSMTGYQEVLTDPSYYGQIVVMTYPLIGNYGLNLEDHQSSNAKVRGFIIKEEAKLPNNFRCEMTLDGYLKDNKIVGLKNIDTRHLTKIIREHGSLKAIITQESLSEKQLEEMFDHFDVKNFVSQVSRKDILEIYGNHKKIAIIDLGIKNNIIDSFKKRNCHLKIFPSTVLLSEIEAFQPDGVFLSNGPGDPRDLENVIYLTKQIIQKQIPVIGICLGHQIITLALGGKIRKMKYGHRGSNHPVKDLEKNKIYITSQNHGYVISEMPKDMFISHINLNDQTIEGIKNKNKKIMSVQFHPEASPGPEESSYIFDDFLTLLA